MVSLRISTWWGGTTKIAFNFSFLKECKKIIKYMYHKWFVLFLWLSWVVANFLWTFQILSLYLKAQSSIELPTLVATLLWKSVRMRLTLLKWGLGSPSGLPKLQSSIARVKTPRPWGVLHIIEKLPKCRCRKWPRMSHLDICSTSSGQKKGRESNWQFDSRPLKVRNWLDPGVYRESVTHRWKALKENYKFVSDLIPIKGQSKELWPHKVPGVQTRTISRLHFGSPGTKSHSGVNVAG
jgi:hypothetical protein